MLYLRDQLTVPSILKIHSAILCNCVELFIYINNSTSEGGVGLLFNYWTRISFQPICTTYLLLIYWTNICVAANVFNYVTLIVLSTMTFVEHLVKGKSVFYKTYFWARHTRQFRLYVFDSFAPMVRPLSVAVLLQSTGNGTPFFRSKISQFCVALDISIAKHTIPSTPAKTATNIPSSPGQ